MLKSNEKLKWQNLVKDKRGITLIALVITIIVLLILAGVSINAVIGENGIATKAKNSKVQTTIAKEKEQIQMAYSSCKADLLESGSSESVSASNLKKQMELDGVDNVKSVTGSEVLTVTYNTGRAYQVDNKGNIKEENEESDMIAGLYRNGQLIYNWQEVIDNGFITIEGTKITSCQEKNEDFAGDLVISEDITEIDTRVFKFAAYLESIRIGKNLTSIGDGALNCINRSDFHLKNIYVDSRNSVFSSIDGVLYTKDGSTLIQYPTGKEHVDVFNIPETVKTIGACAFTYADINSINIPNNVKNIRSEAFLNSEIVSISIPDTVTEFDTFSAFAGCSSLETVRLPSCTTEIDNFMFYSCSNLGNIDIPENVTRIGRCAFNRANCYLTISSSVKIIDESAFESPSNASIEFESYPEIIGDYAFFGCSMKAEDRSNILSKNSNAFKLPPSGYRIIVW